MLLRTLFPFDIRIQIMYVFSLYMHNRTKTVTQHFLENLFKKL